MGFWTPQNRAHRRPRPLTLREALLFPGRLAERGRRDEQDAALGDVHRLQVLHHALQVRLVLVQGDVLLGVLLCSGGTDTSDAVCSRGSKMSTAQHPGGGAGSRAAWLGPARALSASRQPRGIGLNL